MNMGLDVWLISRGALALVHVNLMREEIWGAGCLELDPKGPD